MFTLVFVIPIRDWTGLYRFVFCTGEELNTALIIFALSLLLYAFGLVVADGGLVAVLPVLLEAVVACLVRSMLPPFAFKG
jgi:hypothetical protein